MFMPRYIIRLQNEDKDYYLEWSTVVDAPVTYGMTLDAFKDYYKREYGESSMVNLEQRLTRVNQQGTSCMLGTTLEELIEFNRAGDGESCLTKNEIIREFC